MLSMRWMVLETQHGKRVELNHRMQHQREHQMSIRRGLAHHKAQVKKQEATPISMETHQLLDPTLVVRSSSLKSVDLKRHRRWLRARRWHNLQTVLTAPNRDRERHQGLSRQALGQVVVSPAGLDSEAYHLRNLLQLLTEMKE